jgi:ankyrin repeat protein
MIMIEHAIALRWLIEAHVAADCSNVSALRWLINAGANLNCVAHGGTTPLQLACDYECTTYLLAAGADTLASDNRGRTALFLRAAFGKMTIVHALLAAGADLDATDENGSSARQELARFGRRIDPAEIEVARRDIAKARIDFVRNRALQVCIGLRIARTRCASNVRNPAVRVWPPHASLIPFHVWWKIATTVKHFRKN